MVQKALFSYMIGTTCSMKIGFRLDWCSMPGYLLLGDMASTVYLNIVRCTP